MRTILLIMIGLSSYLSADFTKSGEVVTDSTTGLEWQDNSDANGTRGTWQDVIDYCEALTLESHDDWRLPNINELKSLIDRSKREPAIKGDVFEYIANGWNPYWSSSSVVGDEDNVWIVSFKDGYVDGDFRDDIYYVRCVRDGQ